ncbi:hypothetical protein LY76DRAFT_688624 [Colletotrichum caudatum]|nr:hypothetical protein LY76DRAFT_688624 [Colletotrichum caudatum]
MKASRQYVNNYATVAVALTAITIVTFVNLTVTAINYNGLFATLYTFVTYKQAIPIASLTSPLFSHKTQHCRQCPPKEDKCSQ